MHLFRKILVAFALCATATAAWAQSEGSRTIQWRTVAGPATSPGASRTAVVPTFEEASYLGQEDVPYYLLVFQGVEVGSFEFTQTEFAPLTDAESRSFPKQSQKTEIVPIISSGEANRVPISQVYFQPFRLNPQTGALERLVKFSYRYRTGNKAARAATSNSNNRRSFTTNSVLRTGDWYKIGVPATGIFKIDRGLLGAMGVNLGSVNPKNIKIYGNGGGMLPQPNNIPRPDDLTENAIWVEGEQDGTFDANDYILFYAQGPHTWTANPTANVPFKHNTNLYSDTTYYFLTVGSTPGLRVTEQASVAGIYPTVSSFEERFHHEQDLKNMQHSGREWYGEEFNAFGLERSFTFNVSDLLPTGTVKITSAVMANSPEASSFLVKLNSRDIATHSVGGRGTGQYHSAGIDHVLPLAVPVSSISVANSLSLSYTYRPGISSSALGYLNYITVVAPRQLKLYGSQTSFRSLASLQQPVSTYQVDGVTTTGSHIWNVTNPLKPFRQQYSVSNGSAVFSAPSQELQEYMAFHGNSFPAPVFVRKVINQNLHSLAGNIDLVIITPPEFLAQANRLAQHRRTKTNLQVEVVLLPQIYEEFSSGRQDITAIRDFMRMLYQRSTKSGDDLLKLLLLGDASVDPKRRLPGNTNFIPIYESRESLNAITSHSSDDYIGFLSDTEGEWSELDLTVSTDHYLDIAIGRLPAKTAAEADVMIDKIIRYESESSMGNWRKRLVFFSDDGDRNEHLQDGEHLAEFVHDNHPEYLQQKNYLDLFPQVSVPNGQRAPEANKSLREAVEKGALVVNYTGHGNAVSLADEQVLTISEIQSWNNPNRLNFLLIATCDFGRYDDPRRTSGAEVALLHAGGGSVGALITTRLVYSFGSKALNRAFFNDLFIPKANGNMPELGYLITKSKNTSITGVNNRNFALLGDPSMTLAYPKLKVNVTSINGKPFSSAAADTLKALSKIELTGTVTDGQQLASDFTGQVHITVFDKRSTVMTFGNEQYDSRVPVQVRNNILYDGLASVRNGLFEVSFVVPKDINYQLGLGLIQLYVSNSTIDGHGVAEIKVGSADPSALADNAPPQVTMFMNDESFVTGGTVPADATLIAHLFDDNGINTAGAGIGHEITAILDGKTSEPFILNDFYTADVDSYQSGKVRYPLKGLTAGPHTLELKAWDTHNNSATAKIEFIVASSEKLALNHVYNIPNPFLNKTTFHFDHNRPGQELDVQIQIFTVSGKLIKTLQTISNGQAHFSDLTWDGKDDSNDNLAKGVYIYQVKVRSRQDGSSISRYEKLVLLK
ncbi:type IX secretion system sortase PorU [Rufibacter sp. LB8]|uniref:type IX secretion system sortase PorU n=1 Tax=Rufibacter sp. LB8 TaxID=2777781 RepID=UPI00178C6D48|nr:type IX secretion system sortase PorU [Rufibacter sp. LB8]